MTKTQSEPRKSMNWDFLRGGLFIALVVVLCAFVAFPARPTPRLQPILVQMAAERPNATISIIVQKAVRDSSVEDMVVRLGGRVTTDLSIINAFAAEMKAKDVVQLAMAGGVRWVSLDVPTVETGGPDGTVNTTNLLNVYNKAIGADKLWAEGYQGSSVGVAVVDSGIAWWNDFAQQPTGGSPSRIVASVYPNKTTSGNDLFGHGTLITGIIGGNGYQSSGAYIGVAPKVKIVNVKVSNDKGAAKTSDVVAGLQWVLNHKDTYNIRVVNLSMNSTVSQFYLVDPLDAALEILWFNRIVVVVSAGNNGGSNPGVVYAPANDPFVITVGAADDHGTAAINDDTVSLFSASGLTESGFSKPDLVAPGTKIVSTSAAKSVLVTQHSTNIVNFGKGVQYFRLSGTSAAAPMVSGAVALLLQDEPNLTPDQVKYRLMATANKNWTGYNATKAGAGYLDIYAAVHGTTTVRANQYLLPSLLLLSGTNPPDFSSGSVNWDSVNWDSVNWDSVNWDSVNWDSDYWGP